MAYEDQLCAERKKEIAKLELEEKQVDSLRSTSGVDFCLSQLLMKLEAIQDKQRETRWFRFLVQLTMSRRKRVCGAGSCAGSLRRIHSEDAEPFSVSRSFHRLKTSLHKARSILVETELDACPDHLIP